MARSSTTFGPGNRAAQTHGGKTGADTGSDTGSNGLRAAALETYPWLSQHPELETRYVTTTLQIEQLRDFIEKNGTLDSRGKPRPAVALLRGREKDLASAIKLIESYRPGGEPWEHAQRRLRERFWDEYYGPAAEQHAREQKKAELRANGRIRPWWEGPGVMSPPTAENRARHEALEAELRRELKQEPA